MISLENNIGSFDKCQFIYSFTDILLKKRNIIMKIISIVNRYYYLYV
jgi:hypothetical protein